MATDKEIEVGDGKEFVEAWNSLEYGYYANYDAINGTVIKLTSDVNVNEELNMDLKATMELSVTIDLNGHKLTGTADDEDYFFNIEDKLRLTIMDSSPAQNGELAVRCIEHDAADYDDIIIIREGGKLILESGHLVGNDAHLCGEVNVQEAGYFEMNGGCIRNNRFNGHNEASFTTSYNGAAVNIDDGKFIMNGGVIRDNLINGKGAENTF